MDYPFSYCEVIKALTGLDVDLSLGLLDAAREAGIELLALPPHTTQWFCPLNKTVVQVIQ